MDTPVPATLKTKEVAELLGCSERTVNEMVRRGELPGAHKRNPFRTNSPLVIPRAAVDAFLLAREGADAPAAATA